MQSQNAIVPQSGIMPRMGITRGEGKNDPFGSFFRRGSRIPRVSELISLKLSDNKGLRLIYFL